MKLPYRSKKSKELFAGRTDAAWRNYKKKHKGKSKFSGKAH
jgi:hypothetical protein